MLDERDRRYQLILWKGDSKELQIYQLKTVTYGLSDAPFLAIRSLADAFASEFSIGASVLKSDLYVDDVLTGADDLVQLDIKRRQLTEMLERRSLVGSKFHSN